MSLVQLGIDKSPASLVLVPDLRHLVVKAKSCYEVASEADATSRRNPVGPCGRQQQDGEVTSAAHQPPLRRPGIEKRPGLELDQAREHPVAESGVDLTKPLYGDTRLERPVDAIVDDQTVRDRSQLIDPRRQIVEQPRQPSGIIRDVLARVVSAVTIAREVLELDLKLTADEALAECHRRGLVVTTHRGLAGCAGSSHWHLRIPGHSGTLELNDWQGRVSVKVHPLREGTWAKDVARELANLAKPA